MASGALTQLVAIGAQDANFLSEDEKYSVFQSKDPKINNFVKSTSSMQPKGSVNWGSKIRFVVEREGDLLNTAYLVIKLPKIARDFLTTKTNNYYVRWVDYIGNALVKNIKLFIGGQLIDEQTGDFMQIFNDLYDDDFNKLCLIGMDGNLNTPAEEIDSTWVYIPLKFWFCNNLSDALPLIALQHHSVEIEVEFREWSECYQVLDKKENNQGFVHSQKTNPMVKQDLEGCRLDCNYIYLDSKERIRISQKSHKFLITQTQKIEAAVGSGKSVELNFNHPVKEMFYYFSNNYVKSQPDPLNFSLKTEYQTPEYFDKFMNGIPNKTVADYNSLRKDHILGEARILINGFPRVEWKDYKYYYFLQNYENYRNKLEHNVYLYSFSSNPTAGIPMGSLNFSRVDNSQLQFTINDITKKNVKRDLLNNNQLKNISDENLNVTIYGVNYNYLEIEGGMVGLKYCN